MSEALSRNGETIIKLAFYLLLSFILYVWIPKDWACQEMLGKAKFVYTFQHKLTPFWLEAAIGQVNNGHLY